MRLQQTLLISVVVLLLPWKGLGGDTMRTSKPSADLLATVAQLHRMIAFDVKQIEKAFGLLLEKDARRSNVFFNRFTWSAQDHLPSQKIIQQLDARIPAPDNAAKGPFLHIELKAGPGFSAEDVQKRFGKPNQLSIPTRGYTHTPHREILLVYRSSQGELRFRTDNPKDGRLLSITIDKTNQNK